jgi:hypothetical protein
MDIENYLKIYKYEYFKDKDMIKFIKSVEKMPREIIITKPNITNYNNDDIYKSIENRIPIYYGEEVKSLVNYNTKFIEQEFNMKYAISGKAYIKDMDEKYFYAIHTWGVNLESPNTIDYKNIVYKNENSNMIVNFKLYRQEIRNMIDCIIKSGEYYGLSHIYMPMIGQGSYLSFISYNNKKNATEIFFDEICRSIENTDINIIIVVHDIKTINKRIYKKYKKIIEINNLFEPKEHKKYGIVNAWDSNSFIGNGGSKDNTIDGWFVSGYGPNKNLKNSSILHNHLLNNLYEIPII